VLVAAFFPTALFLSAIYTEALFLAVSAGAFYAARRARWVWAGALGGLAAASRTPGVLVLLPLLMLYLYGPSPPGRARLAGAARRLRPRFPLRADAAWLLLVPLGLAAYLAYMATWGDGDPFTPFTAANRYWDRHFEPLGGVWEGVAKGFDAVRQIAGGPDAHRLAIPSLEPPNEFAARLLIELGFLAYALMALAGGLRRLPLAYGAYAAALLATGVSAPGAKEPLVSLPRYVAVIFPLQLWLAAWAVDRGRLQPVLVSSAALLALLSAEFATFHFVA
jgi:hypothetical protein